MAAESDHRGMQRGGHVWTHGRSPNRPRVCLLAGSKWPGMSTARPTYIRGGHVGKPASFLDDLLALPLKLYAIICMFVQTLINVRHASAPSTRARRASPHARALSSRARSPRP